MQNKQSEIISIQNELIKKLELENENLKDKIDKLEKRCYLAESIVNSLQGIYLKYQDDFKKIYK